MMVRAPEDRTIDTLTDCDDNDDDGVNDNDNDNDDDDDSQFSNREPSCNLKK